MNKVKAYGFCEAGCKRRVPLYDEFERSAAYINFPVGEDGTVTLSPFGKYQITANPKPESIETVANFPEEIAGAGYATAVIGNDIFIIGGNTSKAVYKYNVKTKVFVKCNAQLPYNISDATAEAVGSKIYIFGGQNLDVSNLTKKIYIYDSENDTISTSSQSLGKTYCGAVAIKDDIYVIYTDGICRYSTKEDSISAYLSSFVVGSSTYTLQNNAPAAVIGSKIYMPYIESGSAKISTMVCFDTLTNTCTAIKGLEIPNVLSGEDMVAFGTKLYIFGGYWKTGNINSGIYIFDTETQTLSTSEFSTRAVSNTKAEIIGSDIFIVSGGSNYDEKIQRYNPATYDCTAELTFEQQGEETKTRIDIDICDTYRNRFNLEVVVLANENGNTNLIYELNGERHSIIFADESDSTSATLTISGASEVLLYNSNSLIKVEAEDAPEKLSELENDVGYVTQQYVDEMTGDLNAVLDELHNYAQALIAGGVSE